MKIKLFLFDIDKTFVNRKLEVFKKTKDSVEYIKNKGDLVALNTGRGPVTSKPIAEQAGIRYIVAFNGQSIFDYKENKYLYNNIMDKNLYTKLVKFLTKYNQSIITYGNENMLEWDKDNVETYYDSLSSDMQLEMSKYYHHDKFNDLSSYLKKFNSLNDNIIKVIVHTEDIKTLKEIVKDLKSNFEEFVYYYDSNPSPRPNVEVCLKDNNKMTGALKLIELLKLKRNEVDLVAFGDGDNDVPIFKEADYSVATLEAVPEIDKLSNFKTGSSEDDSSISDGVKFIYKQY